MTKPAHTILTLPTLPHQAAERQRWSIPHTDSCAVAIAQTIAQHKGLVLVVTKGSGEAQYLAEAIDFFLGASDMIDLMPDWEILPYDFFSPHQEIISARLDALYKLPHRREGLLLTPASTLMQRIAPPSFIQGAMLKFGVGDQIDLTQLRGQLEKTGYRCVSEVVEHGEFAVRGSLFDLYPMGANMPFRVDLFDDEIDSIRCFDPETQRSEAKIERVELLPAHEFPTDEKAIAHFRQMFRSTFAGDPTHSVIYQSISDGHIPTGIESYLPLFFPTSATLFDYLPENTLIIRIGETDAHLNTEWEQINERYEQRRHDPSHPILSPDQLFINQDRVREQLNRYPQVLIAEHGETHGPASQQRTLPLVPLERPIDSIKSLIEGYTGRVLLTAETAGRREAWLERLYAESIRPQLVTSYEEFLASTCALAITVAPLEMGYELMDPAIRVVPEAALFTHRVKQTSRHSSAPQRDPDTIIRDLTDLHIGSPVVHEKHGVGRYRGLQTITVDGIDTEFLQLEYAGNDKLYVPVASLHLIGRYTGADEFDAPLHRLGSGQWEKARRKAAEKARDVAAELLDINARRAAQPGQPHVVPAEDYARFTEQFRFEETPDQATAIHAVLNDMQSSKPMDRVVCGDVGFGKTEVAMRAAFAGVQSGRQVAVLVPTTLLAQQHYQNFTDRFADWPVRIEALSRFRSAKETEAMIEALEQGKVDIVIGTHKLLQRSVRFHDLGLLIIDEEQRFGVRQKEKLKQFRATVDVLTLTATPIPRTLNMSLAGLRDLSIIATPPARRLAVKTFVNEWNDATVREACLRELHRGGQVYFLHNEVQSIDRIAESLAELVPEARIRVAHGQMRERELERVMLDFYHRRFNVLVCSTIIESGIDVPSANTIIINRADRLGLAQLHQLRGRVGRSHHRAYAYLMAPAKRNLTPDAAKRLDAIASLEDLGIGFALASHDLEIRGAGELLGEGQSGQIHEVGFSLYSELLERAVKALKSGKQPELEVPLSAGTEVDLHIPALLPSDYLPDVHTRLTLYKRIASASTPHDLRELQVEMIDRFGLLPPPAKHLMTVAELRQKASMLGIDRLEAGPGGGVVAFTDTANIDVGSLVQLVQKNPAVYRLEGQDKLRFRIDTETPEQRIEVVTQMLDAITLRQAA